MTKRSSSDASTSEDLRSSLRANHWALQHAKTHFSELVRRVRSDGPQHVTVHGRDAVVVVSAEEFSRLQGEKTGETLIKAMQVSPFPEVEIVPRRERTPVRDVVVDD